MKELIIKRLELLDVIAGGFIYDLKDYCEKQVNYILAANRLNFAADLISFEEYWDCYNLILDFMSKHNLKRREIDV